MELSLLFVLCAACCTRQLYPRRTLKVINNNSSNKIVIGTVGCLIRYILKKILVK